MRDREKVIGMEISDIIYRVYEEENLTKMRQRALYDLRKIVDFDSASFYLFRNEGGTASVKQALIPGHPVFFHRDENDQEPEEQMIINLEKDGVSLGKITLYRNDNSKEFGKSDAAVSDLIKKHLSLRLYRSLNSTDYQKEKLTISEAVEYYGLTPRETEIVWHILNGQNNEVMCSQLCISINTLKKHIFNIYRKMNIKSRVALFKLIKEQE